MKNLLATVFEYCLSGGHIDPSLDQVSYGHCSFTVFRRTFQVHLRFFLVSNYSGPVFTKGLRLSQVLDLNPVLKLRLLSQLSFVLKPVSREIFLP